MVQTSIFIKHGMVKNLCYKNDGNDFQTTQLQVGTEVVREGYVYT